MKIMETTRKWLNENSNVKYSNLPDDLRQGLNELLTSIENKESVVFETDKSKNFSVNTPVSYRNDMQVHIQNNQVISQMQVNKITKKFNKTSESFVGILGIGDKIGHHSRILNNAHNSNYSDIPVKSGMYKDQKEGRKYRPYVNANVGPISNLSEIISLYLKGYVWELRQKVGINYTVESTEELCALLSSFNENVETVKKDHDGAN